MVKFVFEEICAMMTAGIALIYNSPLLSNLSARSGFSLVNLGSLSSKENEFKISILFK